MMKQIYLLNFKRLALLLKSSCAVKMIESVHNRAAHSALLIMAISVLALHAQGQVTLTDNGTTVTLANGIVSAVIQKVGGKVTTLTFQGSQNLLGSKGDYYTTHVVYGTTDQWLGLGGTYKVVTNTPTFVDISIQNAKLGADTNNTNGLFDVTKHYVMRAGDAGYYTYVVWKHTNAQPAASFYQQRTTVSGNSSLFNSSSTNMAYSYSGQERFGQSVDGALLTDEITDATFKLPLVSTYKEPTGFTEDHFPVWTKYDWAVYAGDSTSFHNTWGTSNDQYGLWRLCPSEEFLNGGPTKLRGGVQGSDVDLNTNEGHGIGNVDNAVGDQAVWQKIYGPFFVYVNKGTDHLALWNDAQAKGAKEVAAWPYTWVKESETLYPRSRSIVKGRIMANGHSGANAMVILGNEVNAAGESGVDWMFQGGTNYIFWNRADKYGNFSIPKVRPGTYTLYSYIPGNFGQLEVKNVVITSAGITDLGTIKWTPATRQQVLWRLGKPDRSTKEFKWGGIMRQFGLWWRYLEEKGQNDLNFTIGTSNPAKDWYYAQPVVAIDNGQYYAPKWNVNFNLTAIPPSPAVVRVALAGSMGTPFYIDINGTNVSGGTTGNYTIDDHAYYRDNNNVGQYQYYEAQFDPSLLKIGDNTLTIRVRKTGSNTWTGTKPVLPAGGIQFDCIQLEAGTLSTEVITHASIANARLSDVASTEEVAPAPIAIYPNPFTHTISIDAKGEFEYAIYSNLGVLVEHGTSTNNVLAGATIPTGMYIVKVRSSKGGMFKKVVKSH